MKFRNLAVATAGAALVLSTAACDRLTDPTGINKNPNAPLSATAELLFPAATSGSVRLIQGSSMQLYFTELWAQHMAEYQYPDDDQYVIRPTTIDGYWTAFYSGPLQDLEETLRKARAAKPAVPNKIAPALVMKSWTYQVMTDMWGDIPYSEANKGDSGIMTPKYDTQQAIYNGILADLTAASSMITADGANGFSSSTDLIYGKVGANDAARAALWKKFANSLRARAAMRLVKANPAKAATEVAAAFAAGGFTSNADNAILRWPGDGQNDSPYSVTFKTRDDHRMSKTLVDTLTNYGDPRLAIFARPTQWYTDSAKGPVHAGLRNGLSASSAALLGYYTSRIGTYFAQKTTPSVLMTYAEYLFILAEAAQRNYIVGSAAAYYNDAIRASMEQYGIANAAITTYLASAPVVYKGAAGGLEQIALQRWIASFGQGTEAWAEYRRSGFPVLQGAAEAKTQGGIVPRRLEYPQMEQSFNNSNLQAAVTAQGGATMTHRIWWDKP